MSFEVKIFRLAAWCSLILSAGAGCGEDIAGPDLVDKLRVLGVRADPPEVEPGGMALLTALVADPKGEGRDVALMWAFGADIPGEIGMSEDDPAGSASTLKEMFGLSDAFCAGGKPAFDMGQPYEASVPDGYLDKAGDAPALDMLAAGMAIACKDGKIGELVPFLKRLTVSRAGAPNRNPRIAQLRFDEIPVAAGASVEIAYGAKVAVRTIMTGGDFEEYEEIQPDGIKKVEKEKMMYSWFATGGEFKSSRTLGTIKSNYWTAPPFGTEGPADAVMWVVCRDRRGGIDWTQRKVIIKKEGAR